MTPRLPLLFLGLSWLGACGGSASSATTLAHATSDPLSLVPESSDVLVRFDVAAMRADTEASAALDAFAARFPGADVLLARCDAWWFAGDFDDAAQDADNYVVLAHFPPDARDEILASLEGDESLRDGSMFLVGDTLVVSGDGFGDAVARLRTHPRRGPASIVSTFRSRERSVGAAIDGVFVPSAAMREGFIGEGDDDGARQFLAGLAEGVGRIDVSLASEGSGISANVDVAVRDATTGEFVMTLLEAMREVPPTEASEQDDRIFGALLQRAEFHDEPGRVRVHVQFESFADLVSVGDPGGSGRRVRGRSNPPSPPMHPALALAQRNDPRGVVALVTPELDSLLERIESDPSALSVLSVYLDALATVAQPSAVLAAVDRVDARIAETGIVVPEDTVGLTLVGARARALEARHDLAAAAAVLEHAVADANDVVAKVQFHWSRAYVLAQMGRLDDALQAMRSALEIDAGIPATADEARTARPDRLARYLSHRNNLAWTYHLGGRDDLGLPIIDEVLALLPASPFSTARNRASYTNTRGAILLGLGRTEEAAAAYRDELAAIGESLPPAHPRRARTLIVLAQVEATLGNREKAIRYARMSVAVVDEGPIATPDAALAHLELARAAHESGDAPTAAAEAQRSVALFREGVLPTHPQRIAAEAFAAAHPIRR